MCKEIKNLQMSNEEVSRLVTLFKSVISGVIVDFDLDISIEKIDIIGSRRSGTHRPDSDLDVLLVYSGDLKEYEVHNFFNGDPEVIDMLNVVDLPVDIFVQQVCN